MKNVFKNVTFLALKVKFAMNYYTECSLMITAKQAEFSRDRRLNFINLKTYFNTKNS